MKLNIPQEAISEFITECEEILARVSASFNNFEKNTIDQETIDATYRDMHTMKGSAQLFGFVYIGKLSHAMEASLIPIRKYKTKLSSNFMDVAYQCLDILDRMVKAVAQGGSDKDYSSEVEKILPKLVDSSTGQFGGSMNLISEKIVANMNKVLPEVIKQNISQPLPPQEVVAPKIEKIPEPLAKETIAFKPEILSGGSMETSQDSKQKVPNPVPVSVAPATEVQTAETSVRVQVGLLDKLMNLVGELVLVRNQYIQQLSKLDDLDFLNLSKSLDTVTSDLQSEVMKTRMQPIGNIVNKFQRVVRDLGKDLGKKIDLTLEGTETELDKTLLEVIKDPLTHIMRNSCDHGIESPEDRLKSGKPETGHVLIRSYHEGGQVIIEVSDDGKGLHKDKLVQKALEKGIISAEKAKGLSEKEIFNLIFLAGFSTAQNISAVSGRGVGMDVVKTNIEKIGGTVDITSAPGKGTSIQLRIPLTLAIVPAMIVRANNEKFAIPQVRLVQLVRVDLSDLKTKIEFLQERPVFRLRGNLLPLVGVNEILSGEAITYESLSKFGSINIVVLKTDGQSFGLIVSEVLDTADIVVKPLPPFLKHVSVFAGATIMGDGSVSLILDINGIAEQAHIDTKKSEENVFLESGNDKVELNSDVQEFLLFSTCKSNAHAIPLCLVHRLEEFKVSDIEASGNQEVIQYRGSVLPLIDVNQALDYNKNSESIRLNLNGMVRVIVVSKSGQLWGLVVNDIIEVLTLNGNIDDSIRDRFGILGNIILGDQIIVAVDALGLIDKMVAKLKNIPFTGTNSSNALEDLKKRNRDFRGKKLRVLYAEDVAFFRRHVTNVLSGAGFDVVVVEDGEKAIRLLEKSDIEDFQIILSDIEMPKMNGLQLAKEIRKNVTFSKSPLIALTTRFNQKDIDEGKKAGFDVYLEKLDPEKLLSNIEKILDRVI